ncbi:MAG: CHASE2 domain-containing protein [Nitrosomonas sp.]|nr:MAG: CHASE2 domain-containing protein [Nitrosomonas sp.]
MDYGPIKLLEQFGIDRSMQLYSEAAAAPKSYRFAFVDVDKAACKLFLDEKIDSDPECRTSKPIPTSLIIDFVRAATESQAALVIIDVTLPEKNEVQDREALQQALETGSNSSNTWIIAPVYDRPSDSENGLTIEGDPRFDIIPTHTKGRILLASAATYTEHGVIRTYPAASCYAMTEGQRWIPTIPYLAALLIANPMVAQSYYRQNDQSGFVAVNAKNNCSQLKIPPDFFKNQSNTIFSAFDPLDTTRIPPIIRFFYSLPSLGMLMDESERDQIAMKHIYNYQYYEASKLIDAASGCMHKHVDGISHSPGCFRSIGDYYQGKIIILGSSRAQAMDHVQTPIGTMSGSELILNATRAFLEFEPLKQSPPLAMLIEKFKGIGVAMIPMFFAWCLIFLSGPATRVIRLKLVTQCRRTKSGIFRRYRWRMLDWMRTLFVIIIFVLGIYTAYIFEVIYLWEQLEQGVATDLLLPALALGLQGFAVGAKIISNTFYQIVLVIFTFILHRIIRFKNIR